MKTTVLLIILMASAAMPLAMAIAQERTQTAPHTIDGVLPGTLTFVPYGPGLFDVNSLGVTAGPVMGLGQVNLFTFHVPTADGNAVTNGRFFLVAANGDRITGTYEGTTSPGDPGQLVGRATWVISGGTGRFAHAAGTIDATAYVTVMGFDVFEWPVVWVIQGTITY